MSFDSAPWGALALALSVLGGVVTWYRWRKNGLPSLLRGTAWSLLPIAAWLTGVLELAGNISGDVGRWAVNLVFSPVVWLGIGVAGLSVVLFGASALLSGRHGDRSVEGRSDGELPGPRKRVDRPAGISEGRGKAAAAEDPDGMDDIEAILRKHGIS